MLTNKIFQSLKTSFLNTGKWVTVPYSLLKAWKFQLNPIIFEIP